MRELLVGTKKGLFVLRGEQPEALTVATRAFEGDVVEFAIRDPRTGRYFASVTSGFFGPRVMWTDDPLGEWQAAKGPAFPEGTDTSVDRIWVITPGEADGVLYAGVAPAALFVSTDGGASWSLNEPLWKERIAGDWQPGFGGLALHSICPWPGDPQRLAVGVSAAGVWLTEDGGASWTTGFTGLVPRYVPEEARAGTNALCVHNMHRAAAAAERLFMQFHGRVYRSDDAGSSWNEIADGLPSGFGFPLGKPSAISFQDEPASSLRYTRPWNCMNSRSAAAAARCMLCTQRAFVPARASSGTYLGTSPVKPVVHEAPPSSVSHTPAADTPTARRCGSPGQGQIECNASPPNPGCQSPAIRSFHSGSFRLQDAPPSVLTKSAAGATPAYRTASASPGVMTQIRSTEVSVPSGNAGPFEACHSPSGSSVHITRGPKKPLVTLAK